MQEMAITLLVLNKKKTFTMLALQIYDLEEGGWSMAWQKHDRFHYYSGISCTHLVTRSQIAKLPTTIK